MTEREKCQSWSSANITTHLECWEVWITSSKSAWRTGPGEETEKTASGRTVSSAIREVDWKGDSGLSRRVAEISASMI